jgi:cobalt-zinc-cadmium efflux system protein
MNHCLHSHEKIVDFSQAFLIAIIANLAFTGAEAVTAIFAHSSSLLADAGHNLGDVLGLALALSANWLARRKPKENYTYGYKRTTILSAFFNALILIFTSALIAFHAVDRWIHPHAVTELYVIIAALVGIAINGGTALLFMKGGNDLNVKGAFLHLAYDALISFGVVLGGVLMYFTHWWWVDSVLGLMIVVTILWGSWGLFRKSLEMLLDAVPPNVDMKKVSAFLLAWPGVKDVHDLHVWSLSTQEVALTAHLYLPGKNLMGEDYMKINCELKKQFNITHVTIQVEQELLGDDKGNIICGC